MGERSKELVTRPTEPLTVLIKPEKAPAEMLKAVTVEDGALTVETSQGRIGVELYVFPIENAQGQIPFLEKLFKGRKQDKPSPVQVTISPRVAYDEFKTGEHIPLMAQHPYGVLQDGARFGILVTAPTALTQQDWSETQERSRGSGNSLFKLGSPDTVWEDGVQYEVREVYKQRKGLALAVRTDGKHPLAQREETGHSGHIVNREMLIGGFRPAQRTEGLSYTMIANKTTEKAKRDQLKVGEETNPNADIQDLVFAYSAEAGDENPEKEKGLVEVIVFEITEDEVVEVIKTPVSRTNVISPFGSDQFEGMKSGGAFTYGGSTRGGTSYQAGETRFGKPKRQTVSIRGVRDLQPIAAFRMVLVGEKPEEGLEMQEVPVKATNTAK